MTRRPVPFQWARLVPYLLVMLVCVALAVALVNAEGATSTRNVAARLHKTESVLRFFHNRPWMVARRAEKCWDVAWQPTCRIARRLSRFHTVRRERLKTELHRHLPVSNDWVTSVRIVQRAFPGTASVLLSCSSAEGGRGDWVIYGGRPYYPGAEYAYTFHGPMVGGPMQYMWPTFKGHYRHGLESLRERGYQVELPPVSDVAAWRSMTAQAIAAGWAFWSGHDDSHWSASARSC